MNGTTCECKDSRIYYVLAGGGLVLLTYIIKNKTQSYQQQLHSRPQEYSNDKQKVDDLENQINILKEQITNQRNSVQRYLQYKSSNPKRPHILTVQEMNSKEQDKIRQMKFNMK